jgi:hypothetical protein
MVCYHGFLTLDSPKLTSSGFASTSDVKIFAVLDLFNYGIKNYGVEVTLNAMTFILNLHENIQIGSKVTSGEHLISLPFIFKK